MRGMILAAGRGQRMRELTRDTPKPLLRVAGRYLIEFSIAALAEAGIDDIVINVSFGADQIQKALGDGKRYGVTLHYSFEKEALETGGGIVQALPYLGQDPFIVMSCDIITDFPLQYLPLQTDAAHLVLVNNPPYHPAGDFGLSAQKMISHTAPLFTFANIGVYHPRLFKNYAIEKLRLGDILKTAIPHGQVTGEYYSGIWHNIGTPEDLALADVSLREYPLNKDGTYAVD